MNDSAKLTIRATGIVIVVYVLSRFFGSFLTDNAWSFRQFNLLPIGYIIFWLIASVAAFVLFARFGDRIAALSGGKTRAMVVGGILLVIFYIFRFDSFFYGGANLLVNQLAIDNLPTLRWYEFGSFALIRLLYEILQLFGFLFGEDTAYRMQLAAGVNAVVLYSVICTAFSIWGAAVLTRLLCTNHEKGCWTMFIILFFGPQSLIYFGYIGIEPIAVPFTLWAGYFVVRLARQFSWKNLGLLWILIMAGMIAWFPLIYLIPAAVFVSLAHLLKQRRHTLIVYGISLFTLTGLFVGAQIVRGNSFWAAQYILGFSGRMPMIDYSLFSWRHISDILQSYWMLFPQLAIIAWLLIRKEVVIQGTTLGALTIMAISGMCLFETVDPVNGMPLDIVRFSVYLAPLSLLFAALLASSASTGRNQLQPFMAALAVAVPLGLAPSYLSVGQSERYIDEYITRNEKLIMPTIHSYRDAYFYRKDFDKANEWEWQLPRRSDDYLNMRGCTELIEAGKISDALQVLPRLTLQHPYWTQPRTLLATIHSNAGRYTQALPQLDTCIMAEPYDPDHYQQKYRCLRDSRAYTDALAAIEKANELSPDNPDILIDLMVGHQFLGNLGEAEQLANEILSLDSTQAFAFAMKGFVAESQGRDSEAMKYYERFILLAPDDPESMKIRKRLNALVNRSRERDDR